MKNLERFSTIFLLAGIISFLCAFLMLGIWPTLMTDRIVGMGLPEEVPEEFKEYYNTLQDYQRALYQGRDIYIKEACWHCHSQYVRPVGNESTRYGLVSTAAEYQNLLNRPQLFGTRRVGPDLVREAGKRSNDWHFAHLYNPKLTESRSVMPAFTWYFDESTNPPKPKPEAIALVAYLQNLGKWAQDYYYTQYNLNEVVMPPHPSNE